MIAIAPINYQSLNNYILNCSNKPFEWGKFDCFQFVNGACNAMLGRDLVKDISKLKYTSAREGMVILDQWLKDHNYDSFIDALDDNFKRLNIRSAPRGAIVARSHMSVFYGGYALGVSVGPSVVFVNQERGVTFEEFDVKEDLVWEINPCLK